MKYKDEIEGLLRQIDEASAALDIAQERFESNDKLVRSLLGVPANANEKQLTDALKLQRSFGEPIPAVDEWEREKSIATDQRTQAEAKINSLVDEVSKLIDIEANSAGKMVDARLKELEQKITTAMGPFFSSGVIRATVRQSDEHIGLSHLRSDLRAHNNFRARWAAVKNTESKLNRKVK